MQNWQEQYYELMFGPHHTRDTMETAALIKFSHMPSFLYKYRSFCDDHKQALEKGVLYCSPPSKLNDLTDTNLFITDEAEMKVYQRTYDSVREQYGLPKTTVTDSKAFVRIIDEFFRQKANSTRELQKPTLQLMQYLMDKQLSEIIEKYRNERRDRYNVCCFSAVNDIDLMWTHYSSNHTGFCIEYDFKSLGVTADDVQLMFPVIYTDDSRIPINDIDKVDQSYLMYGTTVKKSSWSYEQEWRRLFLGGDSAPQPMPKPTAVYLGARTDKQGEVWMKQFCVERKIPLYKMTYNSKLDKLVPTKSVL